MSNKKMAVERSRLEVLGISLLAFIVGYLLLQKWLSVKDNQTTVLNIASAFRVQFCEQGIRLPGDDCQFIYIQRIADNPYSLRETVAGLPDLASSLSYFRWRNGGESEAVRYLVLIQSLAKGRRHQHQKNYAAKDQLVSKFIPIWQKYPKLVAGSSCTYCNNQSSIMSRLLQSFPAIPSRQLADIALDTKFFSVMLKNNLLPPEYTEKLLPLHANMSAAGDSSTAKVIGDALAQGNSWPDLQRWVDRGLNGGRALGNLSLDELPREVVSTAWQQGVSLGYDAAYLTEYLVATGHRPALRWLLWLQSTDYPYLHKHSYKNNQAQYKRIMQKHTYFPVLEGEALANFYNENWRSIKWDDKSQRWSD